MPFATVEDEQAFLQLLRAHPEWRAEVRRELLAEELLGVPVRLERVEGRLERVEGRLERVEAALAALAEAQARTEARVEQLAEAQARTEERLARLEAAVEALAAQVGALATHVAALRGWAVEARYRDRAPAYFGRLVRRLRVLDTSTLAGLLDAAVAAGQLGEAERDDVLLADVVASGRRDEDQAEVYLLAEVSAGVGAEDVRRATTRAAALARLGRPVLPVVAGEAMRADAAALARSQGVWQVLDGQVTPPERA